MCTRRSSGPLAPSRRVRCLAAFVFIVYGFSGTVGATPPKELGSERSPQTGPEALLMAEIANRRIEAWIGTINHSGGGFGGLVQVGALDHVLEEDLTVGGPCIRSYASVYRATVKPLRHYVGTSTPSAVKWNDGCRSCLDRGGVDIGRLQECLVAKAPVREGDRVVVFGVPDDTGALLVGLHFRILESDAVDVPEPGQANVRLAEVESEIAEALRSSLVPARPARPECGPDAGDVGEGPDGGR